MRITDDNGYNAAGKRRKAYCVAHSEFGKCEPVRQVFLRKNMTRYFPA